MLFFYLQSFTINNDLQDVCTKLNTSYSQFGTLLSQKIFSSQYFCYFDVNIKRIRYFTLKAQKLHKQNKIKSNQSEKDPKKIDLPCRIY